MSRRRCALADGGWTGTLLAPEDKLLLGAWDDNDKVGHWSLSSSGMWWSAGDGLCGDIPADTGWGAGGTAVARWLEVRVTGWRNGER